MLKENQALKSKIESLEAKIARLETGIEVRDISQCLVVEKENEFIETIANTLNAVDTLAAEKESLRLANGTLKAEHRSARIPNGDWRREGTPRHCV